MQNLHFLLKKEEWAMLNPYMFLYWYSRVSHRQYWFDFWGSIDLNGPITTLMPIWLHHWRLVRAHFPGCDPWDFLGARWSCLAHTVENEEVCLQWFLWKNMCFCETFSVMIELKWYKLLKLNYLVSFTLNLLFPHS